MSKFIHQQTNGGTTVLEGDRLEFHLDFVTIETQARQILSIVRLGPGEKVYQVPEEK